LIRAVSELSCFLFFLSFHNLTISRCDLTARPERRDVLENEMRKANVICVVYSVGKTETFASITSFWLPLIRRLGVNVPVILVGNKLDLREGPSRPLEEEIMPIMNEWKVC